MDTVSWASPERSPRSSLRAVADRLANGAFSFSCTLTCHTVFLILNAIYATATMQLMNQTHSSSDEMQVQAANHNTTGVILIWHVKRLTIRQPMTKITHARPCTHTEMHALTLGCQRLNNRILSNAGNIVCSLKYWPDCFMITIPGF